MKTHKSTRQTRSNDHSNRDTNTRKLESVVAHANAVDSAPADHSGRLYSDVKHAREVLTALQNDHGLNPAFVANPLPSNKAIEQEYADAHNGEKPSEETVFREVAKRARESLFPPKAHRESAGAMPLSKAESIRWSPRDLKSATRKIDDPDTNPLMTPQEVMACLQLGKSAVYEHPDLQRVSTGRRTVRFTTKSVIAVMDAPA